MIDPEVAAVGRILACRMETYVFHHSAVSGPLGGLTAGVDAAVDAAGSRRQPTIAVQASQRNGFAASLAGRGEIPMAGLQSDGE